MLEKSGIVVFIRYQPSSIDQGEFKQILVAMSTPLLSCNMTSTTSVIFNIVGNSGKKHKNAGVIQILGAFIENRSR